MDVQGHGNSPPMQPEQVVSKPSQQGNGLKYGLVITGIIVAIVLVIALVGFWRQRKAARFRESKVGAGQVGVEQTMGGRTVPQVQMNYPVARPEETMWEPQPLRVVNQEEPPDEEEPLDVVIYQ